MSISLSTHVLDTGEGRPAAGVRVELRRHGTVDAAGSTDDDGRIEALARELPPGDYAIVFDPPSAFFRRVELEIEVGDDRHHHVPLVVSPYSCASYRGS